jgi:hypothetical protein
MKTQKEPPNNFAKSFDTNYFVTNLIIFLGYQNLGFGVITSQVDFPRESSPLWSLYCGTEDGKLHNMLSPFTIKLGFCENDYSNVLIIYI